MTTRRNAIAILALAAAATACDDGFGPRVWDATPDTSLVYSISRPELLGEPAGYDFVQLRRLIIETPGATGLWDVALAEENGQFVFIPASAFPGIDSRSALGVATQTTLESLTRAPGDTASYRKEPVPLRVGTVYFVRTRQDRCIDGFTVGSRYAKFQVVSIDASVGAVRIASVRNPYCGDRALIPPDEN